MTDVVSLLEEHEIRETGLTQEAALVEQVGISFERFAIPDRGVPPSIQAAHTLWARLEEKILGGNSVGIHCRASIGRAGLIATGVLVRMGVPPVEAWQRTSTARGKPVPDTNEQRAWLATAYGHLGVRRLL